MLSSPKNHHFVPRLLQRQWASESEQVKCWKWQNEKLITFNSNIKNIMSETRLYTAEYIDNANLYESQFSEIEAGAARALLKFRDKKGAVLDPKDFEAWACFVLAQRIRLPGKIEWAKHHSFNGFSEIFEKFDPDFDRLNPEPRFSTPAQYMSEYHPNVLANFALHTIVEIIRDPKNVSALLKMKWFVRRSYPHQIILGDDPVIFVGDLHSDKCLIALPISPDEVFFAASNEKIKQQIIATPSKIIGQSINNDQATQAQRLVIGNIEPAFLKKRLRKEPSVFRPTGLPSEARKGLN